VAGSPRVACFRCEPISSLALFFVAALQGLGTGAFDGPCLLLEKWAWQAVASIGTEKTAVERVLHQVCFFQCRGGRQPSQGFPKKKSPPTNFGLSPPIRGSSTPFCVSSPITPWRPRRARARVVELQRQHIST